MNRNERIVIYGLLTTLLLFNGLLMLGRLGSAAYAAPVPASSIGDDLLGPADGVELVGEDDESIILRNTSGHPSWGENPHHRAYSIAFVHIGRLLNGLLAGDAFQEERTELRQEIETKDQDYLDQINALNERIKGLDPDGPESQELRQTGGQLIQEYRAWQQEMNARQDQLAARHLEQAYREMVDAVNVIADRMKIDIVYRFIPTDSPFESHTLEQATMAIRLRPILRYNADLDITLEVMEELSLEAD